MVNTLPPGFTIKRTEPDVVPPIPQNVPVPAVTPEPLATSVPLPPGVVAGGPERPAPSLAPVGDLPAPPGRAPQPQPVVPVGGVQQPVAADATKLPAGFTIKKLTTKQELWRKGTLASQNIQNGIANLIGLPFDAVGGAMKMAGIMDPETDPVLGSENLKKVLHFLQRNPDTLEQLKQIEPAGTTERAIARTSEELGAGIGALVPLFGLARLFSPAGRTVATVAPKTVPQAIGKAIIEPFRTAPVKAAAIETGLATTAGMGAAAAQEVAPGSKAAEITGLLAGAIAPTAAVSAARLAGRGVGVALEPFTSSGLARRTGVALRESATSPAALSDIPKELVEGVRPTTAQATQDPGIAALEQEIARQSPRFSGSVSRLQLENDAILRTELDKLAPEMVAPAEAVATGVQTRVAATEAALQRSVDRAAENVQAKIAAYDEVPSKAASNKIARDELQAAEDAAIEGQTSIWNKIDPENKSLIPTEDLTSQMSAYVASVKKASRNLLPDDILTILGVGGRKGVNTLLPEENIAEIFDVSSRLGADIRATKNATEKRLLTEMKKEVDFFLDGLPLKDEGMISRFKLAKEYSTKMNDVFSRTTVGDVLARRPSGAAKVPESATIEQFFRAGKGSPESMQSFLRAVAKDTGVEVTKARPMAVQSVKNFIMKDLAEVAVKESGELSASLAKRWLEKYRPVLRQFPELVGEFGSTIKLQARLDEVGARQTRTIDQVRKGAARLFLEQDPDKAIASALSSKNPAAAFRELRNLVRNDKQALAGLRRSVLDVLKSKAEFKLKLPDGNEVLKPSAIADFVSKNHRALEAIGYSQKDIRRMEDIAEAARIVAGGSSVRPGARTTKMDNSFLTINQILSRLYGIQRGVVSKRFVIGELGARLINRAVTKLNEKELQSLMERALIDPEFAAEISRIPTSKNEKEILRTIRGHLAQNIPPEDEEK